MFGTDNLFDFGITMMAMEDNDQEAKVSDLINELGDVPTPSDVVTIRMRQLGIFYDQLPRYLKDRIDNEIDTY